MSSASAGNASKRAKTTRGKRGGKQQSFSKAKAKFEYHGLEYFSRTYGETEEWMSEYPKNVADIEALAQRKGWTDFTVKDDVVDHGKETEPHLLFGLNKNNGKVESFCTLDTERMWWWGARTLDRRITQAYSLVPVVKLTGCTRSAHNYSHYRSAIDITTSRYAPHGTVRPSSVSDGADTSVMG